jgi:hypothetical protein
MRFLAFLTVMLCCGVAAAQPRVPCGGSDAAPAYPGVEERPAVFIWRDVLWAPPLCLGTWPAGRAAVVVGFAARFRHDGPVETLVSRFGAVSRLTTVRYWSVTDKKWQLLFVKAQALDAGQPRADFGLGDLVTGREVRFEQRDNRLPVTTVQALTVRVREPGKLQVEVRNAEPVELVFVDVAKPGDIRTSHLFEREGPGLWRYYSITRVTAAPKLLGGGNDASWINRAAALYRHVAGIPTDQEPPVAR